MKASSEEGLPFNKKSSFERMIAVKQSSTTETTQSYLSNEALGETLKIGI